MIGKLATYCEKKLSGDKKAESLDNVDCFSCAREGSPLRSLKFNNNTLLVKFTFIKNLWKFYFSISFASNFLSMGASPEH